MTGKVNAIISGQSGVALLMHAGELASLHAGRGMEVVQRRPSEARFLLGDATDLQVLENVALPEVSRWLDLATAQVDALHVALILLDGSLSDDTRQEAAGELQELMEDEAVAIYVENLLFSHPLPGDSDLAGAFTTCMPETEQTRSFLQKLSSLQDLITEVHLAWEMIPGEAFGQEDRTLIRAQAAQEGLFRDLVLLRVAEAPVPPFLVSSLLRSKIQNKRAILTAWIAPLREARSAFRLYDVRSEREDQLVTETPTEGQPSMGGREAFQRVERQKETIFEEMKRRRFDRVERYVTELIDFQLRAGDPVYACKSLCDLAMKAKGLGLSKLQLDLTRRSTEIKPDDGWSWAQYGEALLNNGRLHEALTGYDRAIAYGSSAESRNGRAEVLKAQNRLSEALSAYEEVIADFPENVVARNGRAEVLKAQNHLGEALSAYEGVIADFPEDVVARNGRAEVLKAQNRLSEALSAYEGVIADFPGNVVARTGWAEVLKAQNRSSEALSAYEGVIADFPGNVVARTGRAEVLKAQNRLNEALSAYEGVIADFPEDVVARNGRAIVLALMERWEEALLDLPAASPVTEQEWTGYHIRGMIYLRTGRTEDALQIFRTGIESCPRPAQREYFRTALAVAQIQQQDFEAVEEILEKVTEPALEAPANLLRFHARGARGQLEQAAEARRRLRPVEERPEYREVLGEIDRRFIERTGARWSDERLIQSEIRLLLAA